MANSSCTITYELESNGLTPLGLLSETLQIRFLDSNGPQSISIPVTAELIP